MPEHDVTVNLQVFDGVVQLEQFDLLGTPLRVVPNLHLGKLPLALLVEDLVLDGLVFLEDFQGGSKLALFRPDRGEELGGIPQTGFRTDLGAELVLAGDLDELVPISLGSIPGCFVSCDRLSVHGCGVLATVVPVFQGAAAGAGATAAECFVGHYQLLAAVDIASTWATAASTVGKRS